MTFIVKTFMFMQKIYFLLLIVFGGIFTASAQLVTTTPDFPLEGKEVTVVFDASLGSGGLIGYTGNVYAHTGVITNNSKNESDWKYAPSKWGDNSEKYKMRSLGNNKWEFKLTPSIREYYGVHAGETIFKMAFVFRMALKQEKLLMEGIFLLMCTEKELLFVLNNRMLLPL